MKAQLLSFLLGLALVAGCATQQAKQPAEVHPADVAVLFSKPEKPSVEVGVVSATKDQPDKSRTWESVLRRQAAALGADAVVVDVRTLNDMNSTVVSGTCIRYTQPQL